MSNSEMTCDVDKSVADVWLAVHHAVHHAVFEAVAGAVYWDVYEAVDWAVDGATYWAVSADSTHPALQDFL